MGLQPRESFKKKIYENKIYIHTVVEYIDDLFFSL